MSTATVSPARPSPATTLPRTSSPQGFLTAFHTLDVPRLVRLLQSGVPMDWSHAARIASLFVSAPLQSALNLVDAALFSRAVAKTELVAPPVFVIGHWRSGTTLIQSLLNLDEQLHTPNLAEVFFPRSFLTAAPLFCPLTSAFLPKTRPQDNVPVGWEEPQEDEIAHIGLSFLTPYRMIAFHHRYEAFQRFFRLETMSPAERREWTGTFLTYLRRLTYKHRKRLVLKSPSNTWRIKAFLKLFPGCKFLYIHRNPYDVFVSTVHLRRTLIPQYSLSKMDHAHDEEEVLRMYEDCFQTYEEDRWRIPQGDLYELRYEDLAADPLCEMRNVYEQLGLPGWETLEPKVRAQLPEHRQFRKNTFIMDESIRRQVYPRLKAAFERFGYDPDESQKWAAKAS